MFLTKNLDCLSHIPRLSTIILFSSKFVTLEVYSFERDLHLQKIAIRKSNIQRKLIVSINLQSTESVTDLRYIFCRSYYIISTMATALIQSETISFDQKIFTVVNDLKKKRKYTDTK